MVKTWVETTKAQTSGFPDGLKLLLSVGGASDTPDWPNIESARTFGTAAGNYAASNGFDGIDFDIEGADPNWSQYKLEWIIAITSTAITAFSQTSGKTPIITHAPQAPYFTDWATGGASRNYIAVEQYFGTQISWYNVQFYNQGCDSPTVGVCCYTTATGLATHSASDCTVFPGSSVAEITAAGIPAHKIVIGKPMTTGDQYSGGGYVANGIAPLMGATPYGGVMAWQWHGPASACNLLLGALC